MTLAQLRRLHWNLNRVKQSGIDAAGDALHELGTIETPGKVFKHGSNMLAATVGDTSTTIS